VTGADFLFIDPPQTDYWRTIKKFLPATASQHTKVLIWLPLHPQQGSLDESSSATTARDEAIQLGCRATRVRWDNQHRATRDFIGCQLLYRFDNQRTADALRATVEQMADLAGWTTGSGVGVSHF